jgi:hypothetical protein
MLATTLTAPSQCEQVNTSSGGGSRRASHVAAVEAASGHVMSGRSWATENSENTEGEEREMIELAA